MADRRARRGATATGGAELVGVPQETLQEFQGAFMYYCHPDGNAGDDIMTETLTEAGLDKLIRGLGWANNLKARDMLRETGKSELDFVGFRDMMIARMKASETEEAIRAQFEKFDPRQTRKIPKGEMLTALRKLGRRPLTESQLEELLSVQGIHDEEYFYYDKFLESFFGQRAKTTD